MHLLQPAPFRPLSDTKQPTGQATLTEFVVCAKQEILYAGLDRPTSLPIPDISLGLSHSNCRPAIFATERRGLRQVTLSKMVEFQLLIV